MIVRIKKSKHTNAWFMRDYLAGRTCEVIAFGPDDDYFVLHPVTKKTGYWIAKEYCDVAEKSKVPTWKQFLKSNTYGYSGCRSCNSIVRN